MKKKFVIITLMLTLIPFLFGSTSYNYSYHERVLHSSPGLNYATHFNQSVLGIAYGEARDFVVYEDQIYLVAAAPVSDRGYSDYLIILDDKFNPIENMPLKEFELSDTYATKVRARVSELFNEINERYHELLDGKIFYPGTRLPMGSVDPFVQIADVTWDIADPSVVATNGTLSNEGSENVTTTITGTFSVWSDPDVSFEEETITLEFDVTVGTSIEGITTTASALEPSYSIENDVLISDINRIIGLDFNEILYETMEDFVLENDFSIEPESNLEILYGDYKILYNKSFNEEFEEVYSNIRITEIVKEDIVEIHGSLFDVPYTMNTASGIDVVDSGIYIADRRNNRILKLSHDYKVVDAFYDVDDPTFDEINFEPKKVVVDPSERMNVVAHNVYEGIIELDSDGSFNRYTGVNPITLTPAESLRRLLMTETQRAKLQRFLPTEYTNLALTDKNFIFATAMPRNDNDENMIQLINTKGVDVLVRNGYFAPKGDVFYIRNLDNHVEEVGPSTFIDIAIGKAGMYSVLDQKRSRIFTYDSEGNLLYINGSDGAQSDKFQRGVALNYVGDDLVVLDASGTLVVYRPTAFGEAVNTAVELHDIGEFEAASIQWEEVLKLNTNYEIAYNGLGKYNLRKGEYKKAMANFKLGHDTYYYSKAFVAYRNEIIKANFGLIMLGIVVIAGGLIVYSNRDKLFNKRKGEEE